MSCLHNVDIGWPVLHKKVILTGDCFSPYYFTRDTNGFVVQRISYSCALNKVKTGRLRGILNDTLFDRYLKVPDNHRYRPATRNFSGQGGFVKLGHSDNHFVKNSRKKGPAGKNSEVSSYTLKTTLWLVNLT